MTETSFFFMSSDVILCLIWIMYKYNWRFFFKIVCNDVGESLSSKERLLRDFLGQNLLPHLYCDYIFLPDLGFYALLLRLFIDHVA